MPMNRRDFVRSVGLGTVGAVAAGTTPAEARAPAPAKPKKKVRMRLGAQRSPLSHDWDGFSALMQYLARFGVEGAVSYTHLTLPTTPYV